MKNIAIIPARSGSKGLKDKNIKLLNGKPMMAYTIEAAINSGEFECVHVSTDSLEYAQIAQKYGADVPFFRSEHLATDVASSWDVVFEVLEKYRELGEEFDTFTLLQPTSPLRTMRDINKAYELYKAKTANAIVSVCETEHSPLFCNTLNDDLKLDDFIDKKYLGIPRQQLPAYFRLNGAIYISDIQYFYTHKDIYHEKCYAYIMDQKSSVDIDSDIDFIIAEKYMEREK